MVEFSKSVFVESSPRFVIPSLIVDHFFMPSEGLTLVSISQTYLGHLMRFRQCRFFF